MRTPQPYLSLVSLSLEIEFVYAREQWRRTTLTESVELLAGHRSGRCSFPTVFILPYFWELSPRLSPSSREELNHLLRNGRANVKHYLM